MKIADIKKSKWFRGFLIYYGVGLVLSIALSLYLDYSTYPGSCTGDHFIGRYTLETLLNPRFYLLIPLWPFLVPLGYAIAC